MLGCAGSGKSTFSRRLAELTGLPLIHLDSIWWKADGSHISRDEFDARLNEILAGESWIIDGDYSRTYEARFLACDTVIFLDYSEEVCMKGITERIGTDRPDMPWKENELDPELVELVKRYRIDNRPRVLALIEKYPEKQRLVFTSRSQSEEWLKNTFKR